SPFSQSAWFGFTASSLSLYGSAGGIGANDDRLGHRKDLVDGDAGAPRVLVQGLGAGRLVDADGAERPVRLGHDIGADPADGVGHLVFAHVLGAGSRGVELFGVLPAAAAEDGVEVHGAF